MVPKVINTLNNNAPEIIIDKSVVSSMNMVFMLLIIIGIIVVFIVISGIIASSRKDELKANWSTEKCKLHVMPFSQMINGTNVTTNFNECLRNSFFGFLEPLLSPIVNVIQTIISVLISIITSISDINKFLNLFKINIKNTFARVKADFEKIFHSINNIVMKLGKIFGHIADALKSAISASQYLSYSITSIVDGPIGTTAKYFCFSSNTKIQLIDIETPINKCIIGDIMMDGSRITGIMKFDTNNVQMYNYKNIIVSGYHPVLENGKWIRIHNSDNSVPIEYNNKYIYCISTSTNVININNIIFSDYFELTIDEQNIMCKYLYNQYNRHIIQNNDINYGNFVVGNTKILMRDGIKLLCNIKIGDYTSCGRVLGVIKVSGKQYKLYKYNNIIGTNSNLYYCNNNWNLFPTKVKTARRKYVYQLITDSHMFETDNYMLIGDHELMNSNPEINDISLEIMNNNVNYIYNNECM
jgi:hypothetical protein